MYSQFFPPQIQGLRQIQYFHNRKKRTLNCDVWVNKINNNILLLNKRKKQNKKQKTKKTKNKKNNSGKSQERESLSSKWRKVRVQFVSGRYGPLSFRFWDLMAELVLQILSLSLGEYSLFLSPLSYQSYSFLS